MIYIPRIARKYLDTSFFHVMVQGINKEFIFKCEEEFLDIDVSIEKKIDNFISEFVKKEKIKVLEIFEKDDILRKLIKYLKKSKNVKYTDIMKRLDITKGAMERLKN